MALRTNKVRRTPSGVKNNPFLTSGTSSLPSLPMIHDNSSSSTLELSSSLTTSTTTATATIATTKVEGREQNLYQSSSLSRNSSGIDALTLDEEQGVTSIHSFTMMKEDVNSGADAESELGSLLNNFDENKNEVDEMKLTGSTPFDYVIRLYCPGNPEFFKQAFKLLLCFLGLQVSYLTWGYMQELIMATQFKPTLHVPTGRFPSPAFCVFSNRFLAVLIALCVVRIKHGAFFSNNKAPLIAFTPCALSNTMSSWSQYASLQYVSFPVQTVFKSSKIIPVMIMGKVLKGTQYPWVQYFEAAMITFGVALFSLLSKSSGKGNEATEFIGLLCLITYVCFDSFTSQWQDKIYQQYGRSNVDPYQMMLGVNMSAICITTAGLVITGDFPIVYEFFQENPEVFSYNVITAITSASGQLCIFYTIKEFGPIVFTVIMTTRQMLSICLSAIVFGHTIKLDAACGALIVFGVLFYQIYKKYKNKNEKNARG